MTQKLPMFGFVWEKVNKEHLKELHKNYNELWFLAERIKIRKMEKLVSNFKDKNMYVVQI